MEGDDGRRGGLDRAPDDREVAEVDAVEGADRDGARPPLELLRPVRDLQAALSRLEREHARAHARGHARARVRRQARERLGRRQEPLLVCLLDRNGPTAVRRSVRQWPPSASAIERT